MLPAKKWYAALNGLGLWLCYIRALAGVIQRISKASKATPTLEIWLTNAGASPRIEKGTLDVSTMGISLCFGKQALGYVSNKQRVVEFNSRVWIFTKLILDTGTWIRALETSLLKYVGINRSTLFSGRSILFCGKSIMFFFWQKHHYCYRENTIWYW